MESEQSFPASASSERSKLLNEASFNRADLFAPSVSNTFAEKRVYATGDQQYGQRGYTGAGRDFETREYSAAFQSNEDPQRSWQEGVSKNHE